MIARARAAAALAAALLLAACNGGGSGSGIANVPPPGNPGAVAPAQKLSIAGVGDSLTAGTQSSGTMGADLPVVGSDPQLGQIGPVQRTQEHGFFALLWQQANGVDITTLSNPAVSPLPLLKPPGVGGLLAPTSTHIFPAPVSNVCDASQIPANQFNTALSLRLNPALNPWDVAIPGQTVHEALFMTGALGDCTVNGANAQSQFVLLNSVVNGESQNFWPILAGFGQGVTQVQAAKSLHAQVATVWLGSNDLLKLAFSHLGVPATSPQAMHDDIKSIIVQLQGSGSKVAVANLVDVMGAATFIPQPAYQQTLQGYITGLLIAKGANPVQAQAAAVLYSPAYAAQETAQLGLGPNGYFTINALFKTLQTAAAQIPASAPPVAPTLNSGDFIDGTTADTVKSLNTQYNASIAAAASETNAALVDVNATFKAIATAGGTNTNPPKCCTLLYRGGLTSLDGLHPSNTGYAIIANVWIQSLNAAYNLGIPAVSVGAVYATDPYAPGNGVSGF
ncbi:MAG TPA: SGNH/GDSL hydrolase family protein [Candidatus Elarobacter sp.]